MARAQTEVMGCVDPERLPQEWKECESSQWRHPWHVFAIEWWGWAGSLGSRWLVVRFEGSRTGRWLVDSPFFFFKSNHRILKKTFKIHYFMSYCQLNRPRLSTIWCISVSELCDTIILLPEFMSLGTPYVSNWAFWLLYFYF